MDLKDLTPEQRAKLLDDLKQEEAAKQKQVKEERDTLKELASNEVDKMFKVLTTASSQMSAVKSEVFEGFKNLIDMKCELYDVKDDQQSHTFSNKDGNQRIKLGYRVLDRYDDTAEIGITKVREYMDSLATSNETAKLVDIINALLRRDKSGNLKSNRVIELAKLADDSDNEMFKEGVQIIVDSHKPEKSSYFIEAEYKNEFNAWITVPLSVSAAPFLTK